MFHPLAGKRIVVTRPRAQADSLCEQLAAHGATVIRFPTIEITPLEDYALLDAAMQRLTTYDWLIFTSVNGVRAFWERLSLLPTPPPLPHQIAAIGPATAKALAERGVTVMRLPEEYVAESLLESLGQVQGQRILLPRAEVARELLTVALTARGAMVDEIPAYRTLPAQPDPSGLAELKRGVDIVTFTSSSTVTNFLTLTNHLPSAISHSLTACIGPITAQTARAAGLPVHIVATEYTTAGLVNALVQHYATLIPTL